MVMDLQKGSKGLLLVLAGAVLGALVVIFLVYPPAPGWGSNEKWGDISSWAAVIGAYIAAGVTIWAVLVSIEASRTAVEASFQLRELDRAEDERKSLALQLRLAVMFRAELYLLGSMYALYLRQLQDALRSANPGEMRHVLEMGIPSQRLALIDRFAADLYVFPETVSVFVAAALTRWYTTVGGPPPTGVSSRQLPEALTNTVGAMDAAIREIRVAHHALRPFMPRYAEISKEEERFSDLREPFFPNY